MLTSHEKLARLRQLYELSHGQEPFDEGVSIEEEMDALIIGDWAFMTFDEADNLALSFHVGAHPISVSKLTRFLCQHDIEFVLYESFTISDDDEIIFESDLEEPESEGGGTMLDRRRGL